MSMSKKCFWTRLLILIHFLCTYGTSTYTLSDTYTHTHWLPCSSPMKLQYCRLALYFFVWLYSPTSCFMSSDRKWVVWLDHPSLTEFRQGQVRVKGVKQRPGKYKYYIAITMPPKAFRNSAIAMYIYAYIYEYQSICGYSNPLTNTATISTVILAGSHS